ncbi:phage tail tube protein [Pelagibacterium sediminicola]|uniref:phage tail tube protein n=1 Tax=Pelagibacterium sediminicola TaxID=2248761 RepID=UPI000E30D904|nr:phage tail tube protein [Pelagibacterium sediminicola]
MTDSMIGYLTGYRIWDPSGLPSPNYFDVGEVFNVTPGEASSDRVDATHMKSPGRRREFVNGLIDSGTASFEVNWIPGNGTDEFLRTHFEAGDTRNHQIEFPNGVIVTFPASITGYSKAVPLDDRLTATIEVSVNGEEVWSAASAPTNIALPAISGLAKEGETLTAWEGIWTDSPSFAFQWLADGTPIPGATSSSYTLDGTYIGDPITVTVTATNSAGSDTATSVSTANVAGA